jgi:hypothetical protein
VLVLSNYFKSLNMLALLLIPRDPTIAFWVMAPVFMLDAALNAGINIANNGFMIKNSPAENRAMFIAAGTALAGIVGGVTSVATGAWVASIADWKYEWGGREFCNLHLAFALSMVLRLASVFLARRVREPLSQETIDVVVRLIGIGPLRVLHYPVGLYRSLRENQTSRPRVRGGVRRTVKIQQRRAMLHRERV